MAGGGGTHTARPSPAGGRGAAPGAAGRCPIMSAACGSKDTSWTVPTAVLCRFSALLISDSLKMHHFITKWRVRNIARFTQPFGEIFTNSFLCAGISKQDLWVSHYLASMWTNSASALKMGWFPGSLAMW